MKYISGCPNGSRSCCDTNVVNLYIWFYRKLSKIIELFKVAIVLIFVYFVLCKLIRVALLVRGVVSKLPVNQIKSSLMKCCASARAGCFCQDDKNSLIMSCHNQCPFCITVSCHVMDKKGSHNIVMVLLLSCQT